VKNTEYLGARGPYFGSPDSHLQLLEVAIKVIPVLAGTPLLQRYGRPTLWHTDLHMGNIFVSEEVPTEIVGVIDWQFISILPGLTQARWPEFLAPPEDYETGAIEPKLPSDFEEMDPDEQAYVISQRDQALQAKCYEVALSRCHRDSYLALTGIHDTLRRLFILCERTYKDGVVPLRDCLIELSSNWERIGLTGSPPMTLSKEELTTHEVQLAEYQD
jgi:Phosphotransferase enzyme family